MKWKNKSISDQPKARQYEDVKKEEVSSDQDYKEKAKKLHPDSKDPFLKSRYTKRFQQLNNAKGKK